MRNPFGFFRELMKQPLRISIWVLYLMAVHLAAVAFWDDPAAKLVLATFMVSAMMMMGLYSRFGFERILGLGHVLWIPLLVYVLLRIPATEGSFQTYLVVLAGSIAVSLVFDTLDVWRYFRERR